MKNNDRNIAIHAMRQSGASFREIGKKFGVSGSRVQQICRRVDRDNARRYDAIENLVICANPDSGTGLNCRVYNVLRRNGIDTEAKLMRLSDADVRGFVCAGDKTVDVVMKMQSIVRDGIK